MDRRGFLKATIGTTAALSVPWLFLNCIVRKSILLRKGGKGKPGMELRDLAKAYEGKHMTHMGVIGAGVRYIGREISDGWLYGATGYAFIMNIAENVAIAGPGAAQLNYIRNLEPNLGISTRDRLSSVVMAPDFAEKQVAAWEFLKEKLDAGIPCYGTGVTFIMFFVIYGYEREDILYASDMVDGRRGRVSWRDLGRIDDGGGFEVGSVEAIDVVLDDRRTVKDAFEFALSVGAERKNQVFDSGVSGLAAYDAWIAYIEAGTALAPGISYNADCWQECRYYAEQFLREAGERIGAELQPLFEGAADHYKDVHVALNGIRELFPFGKAFQEFHGKPAYKFHGSDYAKAVEFLKTAKAAEAAGLQVIGEIVAQL